jgi:hypothetical protein
MFKLIVFVLLVIILIQVSKAKAADPVEEPCRPVMVFHPEDYSVTHECLTAEEATEEAVRSYEELRARKEASPS